MSEEIVQKEYDRGYFEAQVLTTLKRIDETLAEMKREHDALRRLVDKKADKEMLENHEDRISKLEQYRWWLAGMFTVIAFGASFAATIVANKL